MCQIRSCEGKSALLTLLPGKACDPGSGMRMTPVLRRKAQSPKSALLEVEARVQSLCAHHFVLCFQMGSEPGWEDSIFIALSSHILSTGHGVDLVISSELFYATISF